MVNNAFFSIAVFLINPFLGFVSALFDVRKNPYLYKVIASLFFALLSYSFVPYSTMDLATYYNNIDFYSQLTYMQLINESTNVLIRVYVKFINSMGLNKEFIPFFITLISYLFYFSAYENFIKNKDVRLVFILNLLLLLTISFLASANGLRNGFSTSLIIYAISLLYLGRKYKFILLSTIAMFVHSYAILIFLIVIISFYFQNKNLKLFKLILLSSIAFSFFSASFINELSLIVSGINPIVDNLVKIYINGSQWGGAAELSQKSKTVQLIQLLPFYCSVFFLLRARNINVLYIISIFTCALTLITNDFWVISERYAYASTLISLLYFLSINSNKKVYFSLLLFQLVALLWSLFRYRYSYFYSLDFYIYPSLINMYFSTGQEYIKVLN
ncbi:EpsG family protein [Aliivibrio fischeri]|uniref:EpsG family protein n=1 Tax=Aliivibrio fischeri TaxID=668 RepID=UPI00080DCE94|nr:EpsG family protein [Aliivibrio fischeri]OCH36707.1 hypothetical protein A6E02_18880 [Aliivibrio fischeri]